MKSLLSQGIEAETPNPNSSSTSSSGGATILTEERIEQLDSLGFNWDCPDNSRVRLSWEHRFTELCEYYQVNGHWPPRTAGTIGEWAHKQKTKEVKRDKVFMEKYYAKLDSIGFPWRGECTVVIWLFPCVFLFVRINASNRFRLNHDVKLKTAMKITNGIDKNLIDSATSTEAGLHLRLVIYVYIKMFGIA